MIAGADPGDTIQFAAGTYGTALVVDKPLTLAGAQAGQDARTRTGAESVLSGLAVTADGVTVDGFTVEGNTAGPGIDLGTGANRAIVNNVLRDNVYGLDLAGSQVTVERNVFESNNEGFMVEAAAGNGIYSDQGASDVEIADNRFTGGHQNASVIFVGSGGQSDIAITGNELVDDSLVFLVNTTGVVIARNEITSSAFHAIQLDGGNAAVDIADNEFLNSAWSAVRVSNVVGAATNHGVIVRRNTLTGQGDHGIKVSNGAHSGTLDAHHNRIAGSGINAVQNDDSDPVDARYNWWGCNSGCDATAGNVDESARLLLGLTAAPTAIGTGGETSTLTADMTRTSSGDDFASVPLPPAAITFATDLGSVASPNALSGGVATSTLTSGADAGTANVTATLDSQTVAAPVRFDAPPPPPRDDPPPQNEQQQQEQEPPADTSGPGIAVVRRTLRLSNTGFVHVSAFCPAEEAAGCPVDVTIDSAGPVKVRSAARTRRRQVRFAKHSQVIAPGLLTNMRVRFTRRGRRIARKLRKVRLTVTVVSRDALGNATTVALPFKLVAPRPPARRRR